MKWLGVYNAFFLDSNEKSASINVKMKSATTHSIQKQKRQTGNLRRYKSVVRQFFVSKIKQFFFAILKTDAKQIHSDLSSSKFCIPLTVWLCIVCGRLWAYDSVAKKCFVDCSTILNKIKLIWRWHYWTHIALISGLQRKKCKIKN
jgi:hypothetical protein